MQNSGSLSVLLPCLLFTLLPVDARELERSYREPALGHKIRTVMIDPGHGGKDGGSLGSKGMEKEIALKIALKLGNYISQNMPDVKVVYTRKDDTFVPLYERAQKANEAKADVFISIHCNSLPKINHKIKGTETYVMGLHTAEENLAVAKRENEAILQEDNYLQRYGGYDPNSPEAHIMLSMFQNAFIGQSILLAEKIEAQFKTGSNRPSRGVKQAGFVVLKATAMPSVLIETGFLSHPEDERYLISDKGQVYIASAIYRAFRDYKAVMDKEELKPKTPQPPKPVEIPEVKQLPKSQAGQLAVAYRVQLAFVNEIDRKTAPWKDIADLLLEPAGQGFKCLAGNYSSLDDAVDAQTYWRAKGFPDAFVVAYKNGKRVSIREVKGN